ncbi:MAG TPA: EamA family transporter [Candidatus Hypogeohydataceae bacterium YC38]
MNWLELSVLSALFSATTDTFSKKAVADSDVLTVAWVRFGYALPFLLPVLVFIEIPRLDSTFFVVNLLLVPLEIIALVLYIKAIKLSPLSLTLPFLAFTPVFLIGTSFLMLGERPDRTGLAGIVLVAMGAYLLNVHTTKEGILAPLQAIAREEGSMLMVVVAFIYSITSNLGKTAIQHSSPAFFAVFYPAILALALLPLMRLNLDRGLKTLTSRPLLFAFIGLSNALQFITHCIAIMLVEVPYMISIKRTALLFGIIYGWMLFRETNLRERLLGGLVMLIGVGLITLR